MWSGALGEWVNAGYTHDAHPTIDTSQSSYYVTDQFRVEATTGLKLALSLGLNGYYFMNEFPAQAVPRTDRIASGEAWAGYRHHGWQEYRVYVGRSRRNSTEPGFDYQANTYGAMVRLGF